MWVGIGWWEGEAIPWATTGDTQVVYHDRRGQQCQVRSRGLGVGIVGCDDPAGCLGVFRPAIQPELWKEDKVLTLGHF